VDFDSFLRQLGANIRHARWIAGLTQEEVAAQGLTYRYFQEMERGRRNPTMRTLFTLARILGSSVSLLTQTDQDSRLREKLAQEAAAAKPPKRGRKPRPKAGQSSGAGRVRRQLSPKPGR
jgi:transcriptional regulator with XRE-family HTH domain